MSRAASTARAGILAALSFTGAALAAPAERVSEPRSERLAVTVRSWAFEGRPLVLRVETRGALAAQPVDLLVFVDDRHVADARTDGGVARVEVPAAALSGAGRRRVVVKSGSERTGFEVKILPRSWLWAGGAVLLAAAAGTALLARRRER